MSKVTRLKPDIVTIVRKEGMELRQRGKYSWGLCPFHQEKTPSFKVDSERQTFHCFGCGRHGDVITFVEGFRGLSFKGALSYLELRPGRPQAELSKESKKVMLLKAFKAWCGRYYSELCEEYRTLNAFLIGLKTPECIEEFGELLHYRADIEYQLDLLLAGDAQDKFLLFCEVTCGV